MDTRKSLQTAARRTDAVLTSGPLNAAIILCSLLFVLQHKYAVFGSASIDSARNNIAPTATANHRSVPQLQSTASPVIDASPVIELSESTDTWIQPNNRPINPDTPLATSMSGSRVPLTSFLASHAVTGNKKNSAQRSNPADSADASNTAHAQNSAHASDSVDSTDSTFHFRQSIEQRLFTAVVSSPFAIGFGDDARLAIWQQNPQFAFAENEKANTFVVMLDPGHGGSDPGSVGHNGLKEKMLTLDIAKRAKRLLSKNKQVSVVLTRNSDYGLSRKNRVRKVKSSNADMFVSLHLNHLPQTDVNLVETFYAAPHNINESIEKQRVENSIGGMVETAATPHFNMAFTRGSKQLASIMQRRVFNEVNDNNPETDNAGVKADTLYILTRSFTPGALIEMSCLSNEKEAERLSSPAYREKLATALANGILDYLATAAKHRFGLEV